MNAPSGKLGIDMLSVKKGDALAVDLRDASDQKFVIALDGGTQVQSDKIVDHVKKHHAGIADLAILTHPDTDHIGGMLELIKSCEVKYLIANDPRTAISEQTILGFAKSYLAADQYDVAKSALDRLTELTTTASKNGVKVFQLFSSPDPIHTVGGWSIYVLGPNQETFLKAWSTGEVFKHWVSAVDDERYLAFAEIMKSSVLDDDDVDTTPINNTSIITLIEGHGSRYLFTGDTGKAGLRHAITVRDITNLTWLDVPHHGSRRNIDTKLIAHLSPATSFISSPGSDKHPRKAVVRALQKAGSTVYSTCKCGPLYHYKGLPREGYVQATPWEAL